MNDSYLINNSHDSILRDSFIISDIKFDDVLQIKNLKIFIKPFDPLNLNFTA